MPSTYEPIATQTLGSAAATAIVKGFILVSHDSDLLRVEELTLENWLEE